MTFQDTDCVQTAICLGAEAPKAGIPNGKPLPWKVAAVEAAKMKSLQAQIVQVSQFAGRGPPEAEAPGVGGGERRASVAVRRGSESPQPRWPSQARPKTR